MNERLSLLVVNVRNIKLVYLVKVKARYVVTTGCHFRLSSDTNIENMTFYGFIYR